MSFSILAYLKVLVSVTVESRKGIDRASKEGEYYKVIESYHIREKL